MSDDAPSKASQLPDSASTKAQATSGASTATAPPGHAIRRSFTFDETRRRPPFHQPSSGDASFETPPRRRSSNFTDYSFGEARDILNPQATTTGDIPPSESSSLASASLAFALLPALAGALFKNGSAIATDLMLLGLAGIFLHWSVTQPW